MRYKGFMIGGVLAAGLYVGNASHFEKARAGEMSLLSHRGVHQTFDRKGLTNETCTAERIFPPEHNYLENTLAGFAAAIEAGADIIELDVHPTTDGEFVVFHDWTLDCRTNGTGRTRDHDLAGLKALDIGYGYTADGGQTYPFRGEHVGGMPTLTEVLTRFPNVDVMINVKSRSRKEGEALAAYLADHNRPERGLTFFGHPTPLAALEAKLPMADYVTRRRAKDCLKGYVLLGWSGRMPPACENMTVPVPANYRRLIWGWPHRFENRLQRVGSRSMLIGPMDKGSSTGIDRLEQLRFVPDDYRGIVFTNRPEVIGPALAQRAE